MIPYTTETVKREGEEVYVYRYQIGSYMNIDTNIIVTIINDDGKFYYKTNATSMFKKVITYINKKV